MREEEEEGRFIGTLTHSPGFLARGDMGKTNSGGGGVCRVGSWPSLSPPGRSRRQISLDSYSPLLAKLISARDLSSPAARPIPTMALTLTPHPSIHPSFGGFLPSLSHCVCVFVACRCCGRDSAAFVVTSLSLPFLLSLL